MAAFKEVSWLISDTHPDCQGWDKKKGPSSQVFHLLGILCLFFFIAQLSWMHFLVAVMTSSFWKREHLTPAQKRKGPSSVFLHFPSSTFYLRWSDESPSASVKVSGWFYSWLSITCLVKNKNMCSPLISNQWSIKQAICLIRAKGPSGPWLI